jgi:uncharacterized protein YycO
MIMRLLRMFSRPVAQVISKLHAPFSRKLINGEMFRIVKHLMQPGDILLSRTRGEFGNFFIPGFWKHVAIVGKDGKIVEAVTAGVHRTNLFDFMRAKDYVALVRPMVDGVVREAAAFHALNYVGAGYDFEFEARDKEFYCSELVARAYKDAGQDIVHKKGIIYPSDFEKHLVLFLSPGAVCRTMPPNP